MATTTKKDLIDWIADETGQKRTTVKRTVQCFLNKVIDELSRGNRLEFRDFGVFEIRDRAPRVVQEADGDWWIVDGYRTNSFQGGAQPGAGGYAQEIGVGQWVAEHPLVGTAGNAQHRPNQSTEHDPWQA